MKAIDFLKKLEGKDFFKEFKKENPDAFLCAFFCILNKQETEGDKINIDFFVPSKNKIAFSESPFSEIQLSEQESKDLKELKDLDKLQIDLQDLWEEIETVKQQKNIKHNTGKIIGVLTQESWNLTCMGSSLDLLKIKINPYTKQVLEAKTENLSDMIKIQKK